MSNADELAAGTDPLDGDSFLNLRVEAKSANIRLIWQAVPGVMYQIIASDRVSGPYEPLFNPKKHEGPVTTEMDAFLFWPLDPDPNKVEKPASFYRLQVIPQE